MKNRILLLLMMLTFALTASSQNLEQGRKYFYAGNFQAAKPIMLKYLKQSPNDASRNYWYGVCLYETGEPDKCLPYLKKAEAKKIVRSYRYLGKYYEYKEQYALAIDYYERFVEGSSADKDIHDQVLEDQVTAAADSLKRLYRMIRNTAKICFIDSFTVSKDDFFQTYMLGKATGEIGSYSDFFSKEGNGDVFAPEMGNTVLYSHEDADNQFRLYQAYKSFDQWVDATQIEIPGADGDLRYPFLESDGVTIYFAGNGSASIGGYDIFVSRLNPSTGRYLAPENIGMPFNSTANDYMYVIDEVNNLGWFATDRRQPEDTVCIYVFVPEEFRRTYQYEGGDTAAIHRASRLISIKESQSDLDLMRSGRQSLTMLRYNILENESNHSFTFVIDDLTDYHEVSDFRNDKAREKFVAWEGMKEQYQNDAAHLEKLRNQYADASRQDREKMTQQILTLENSVLEMERTIASEEIVIRNLELEHISR